MAGGALLKGCFSSLIRAAASPDQASPVAEGAWRVPLLPSFPKRRALIESFRSLPSPSSRLPQFSISLLSSLSPSLNQVKEEERTRHSIRQGDVVASYET